MKRRDVLAAALGALAVTAMAGGVAYAKIAGPGTVYSACVLKGVGQMRLIDKSLPPTNPMSRCTDKETEISWNQEGQPGARVHRARREPTAPPVPQGRRARRETPATSPSRDAPARRARSSPDSMRTVTSCAQRPGAEEAVAA